MRCEAQKSKAQTVAGFSLKSSTINQGAAALCAALLSLVRPCKAQMIMRGINFPSLSIKQKNNDTAMNKEKNPKKIVQNLWEIINPCTIST
jgi:hypothetical protein